MIPQETVQKIIDTAQIIDVVSDFVTLKKRGVNYLGLCPFHNEKTPSFTVSPAKNIYKCFGCGEAGNPVGFIMKHESIGFAEALKYLAKKYHIEIVDKELSKEELEQKHERESLLIVTAFAQKQFTDWLHNNDEGKNIGLSYFKERGFKDEIIKKFELGYCIDSKDAFTEIALKAGYKLEFLEKSGLTVVKENFRADRFYARVIFPIHSLSGSVIAFGGRTLKAEKTIAKYLNSPESDIYHKSNTLYGIYFAKNAISKLDKCYMVEGYTDVMSLHQAGVENVVASSGTSLTVNQIRLVKRFTNNLTILYDGDYAGVKASLRGIDLVLEEGLNVKVVPLPDNEDPDSFSKKLNPIELQNYIRDNEEDFIRFKTRILIDDAKNDPIKKATLITDIVRSVAIIPDTIIRAVYIKECSGLLDVREDALYDEIAKILTKRTETDRFKDLKSKTESYSQSHSTQLPGFISKTYSEVEEKEIIYYLLNFGNDNFINEQSDNPNEIIQKSVSEYIINEVQNENMSFDNLVYRQIFEKCREQLLDDSKVKIEEFLNHTESSISSLAATLLSQGYIPSKIWEKKGSFIETPDMTFRKDIPKMLNTWKLTIIQKAIHETTEQIKTSPITDDLGQIYSLIQQKILLDEIQKTLAAALERIIFGKK